MFRLEDFLFVPGKSVYGKISSFITDGLETCFQ